MDPPHQSDKPDPDLYHREKMDSGSGWCESAALTQTGCAFLLVLGNRNIAEQLLMTLLGREASKKKYRKAGALTTELSQATPPSSTF